jgi:serine/threonine protein kinase
MELRKLSDCVAMFDGFRQRLELLLPQAVVHGEKFSFFVAQFRAFCAAFAAAATDERISADQGAAIQGLGQSVLAVLALFGQAQSGTWTDLALDQPSSAVLSELWRHAEALRAHAEALGAGGAALAADDAEYRRRHAADLRLIQASFRAHAEQGGAPDGLVLERLASIDAQLAGEGAPAGAAAAALPVQYRRWRVDAGAFEALRELRRGPAATVRYGVERATGREVALKELAPGGAGDGLRAFRREVAALAAAEHDALLEFVGATDAPPLCIVTRFMPGGTLHEDLHRLPRLTPTQRLAAAYDVARGLAFLHARAIVHRNLKASSVLIDAAGRCRVGGFALSRQLDAAAALTRGIGAVQYMAPELLDGAGYYDEKVDVYAFGVLLWEMVTARVPFDGMDPRRVLVHVLRHDARMSLAGVPGALAALIARCWDRAPDARPSFAEIVREIADDPARLQWPQARPDEVAAHVARHPPDERGGNDYSDLTITLDSMSRGGVEERMIPLTWRHTVAYARGAPIAERVRAGLLFLKTRERDSAAKFLRELPQGQVQPETVCRLVNEIPSDAGASYVTSILILACKNGAADWALLKCPADRVDLKTVALEVVAQHGAKPNLVAAVADACVNTLGATNEALVCAALRALIRLGGMGRLSAAQIARLVTERKRARNCAYVIGARLALDDREMTVEAVDRACREPENRYARAFVVAAARSRAIAAHLCEAIEREGLDPGLAFQVLVVVASKDELQEKVRAAAAHVDFTVLGAEVGESIARFRAALGI